MGARRNICVRGKGYANEISEVYLYTHWLGQKLPAILKAALRRGKDRWSDRPYLARIIFCEMVKGAEMDETGFGIDTEEADLNYPTIVVDVDYQLVDGTPFQEYIDA